MKIIEFIKSILGIFEEDSPVSMARVLAFLYSTYGIWMSYLMFLDKRPGLEIAAVITACFTPAAGLKIWSKKFEVQGFTIPGSTYMQSEVKK